VLAHSPNLNQTRWDLNSDYSDRLLADNLPSRGAAAPCPQREVAEAKARAGLVARVMAAELNKRKVVTPVYFEGETSRRAAMKRFTRDKARCIAVNIAKLSELLER
jgi:hypothetical protein